MLRVQKPYFQNALDVAKSCMHVLIKACSGTMIRVVVVVFFLPNG